MSNKYQEILSMPELDCIEPERKQALLSLMNTLEGKSTNEALEVIMNFSRNLPQGKTLSKVEQNAVLKAVLSTMSDEEQARFQKLLEMMGI